ncbi:MAG: 2-iminoacetate synthase ThiH [Candidatus Omnitrophica bacterium]|nr:2-iminoacetate synthase ThiH [Candidatus Omnitrophota bacterium]
MNNINKILNDTNPAHLEALARQAQQLTRQYFGRAIGLYTPLYLSNYCASHCTYCGFHSQHKIRRIKLAPEEIRSEMKAIAASGVQNILLLTGESPQATPLNYLIDAVKCAKEFFQGISLEIYPMTTDEYRALYQAGADGVTIYQETYDRARYAQVHLAGQKKDYTFRYEAPERIGAAGMRQISIGALLGLGPLEEDLNSLYTHLRTLENKFPGAEYSISFPRLRTIKAQAFAVSTVDDATFVKILCLTRTLFPRVGINLSTRETAALRNRLLELCVTRISVGSKTGVGGYHDPEAVNDPQFDVADERSTPEMIQYLKDHNLDPVFTDWRRIENT